VVVSRSGKRDLIVPTRSAMQKLSKLFAENPELKKKGN
jgi:hypothetical protein